MSANTQLEAVIAARSLADAALSYPDCPENIDALLSVPSDGWPDDTTRGVAGAIASLNAKSEKITIESVAREVVRLGYHNDLSEVLVGIRECQEDITGRCRYGSCRPEREAGYLIERHAKIATLTAARTGDPSAIKEALKLFEGARDTLPIADVIAAGEVPEPILLNGPGRGAVSTFVSEAGLGKSYCLLDLCLSLALGRPLGIKTVSAMKPGRALVLSWEDPVEVIRDRADKIIGINKAPEGWQAFRDGRLAIVTDLPGPIMVQEGLGKPHVWTPLEGQLSRTIRQNKYDLVVLDTWACAVRTCNENDNGGIAQALAMLVHFAKVHNVALLLVHHASKAGSGVASALSSRGASSMNGSIRWSAQLTQAEGEDIKFTVTKNNYHRKADPFMLKRSPHGPLTEVSAQERGAEVLVTAVVAAMGANGVQAVTVGGIKQKLGDGSTIVDRVQREYPWATPAKIAEAAELAVSRGKLQTEEIKHNRNKVQALRVVSGFSSNTPEEDAYDDETPF